MLRWSRSTIRWLQFPAGKVYVILSIVLVATNVEVDLNFLTFRKIIEQGALVFDDLKLEILWILVVLGRHHKLALRKAAWESLGVADQFDGAVRFVHRSPIFPPSPWVSNPEPKRWCRTA